MEIESLSWFGVCLVHAMWYMATKSGVAHTHIGSQPQGDHKHSGLLDTLWTIGHYTTNHCWLWALGCISGGFVQSFCSDVHKWQIEHWHWRTSRVIAALGCISGCFVRSSCSDFHDWQIEHACRTSSNVIAGQPIYLCSNPPLVSCHSSWALSIWALGCICGGFVQSSCSDVHEWQIEHAWRTSSTTSSSVIADISVQRSPLVTVVEPLDWRGFPIRLLSSLVLTTATRGKASQGRG